MDPLFQEPSYRQQKGVYWFTQSSRHSLFLPTNKQLCNLFMSGGEKCKDDRLGKMHQVGIDLDG